MVTRGWPWLAVDSPVQRSFELLRGSQRSNECACLSHARVGMDCTISIETSKRQNGGRLNFAVCVSFREDKAKTKQLRFLP